MCTRSNFSSRSQMYTTSKNGGAKTGGNLVDLLVHRYFVVSEVEDRLRMGSIGCERSSRFESTFPLSVLRFDDPHQFLTPNGFAADEVGVAGLPDVSLPSLFLGFVSATVAGAGVSLVMNISGGADGRCAGAGQQAALLSRSNAPAGIPPEIIVNFLAQNIRQRGYVVWRKGTELASPSNSKPASVNRRPSLSRRASSPPTPCRGR